MNQYIDISPVNAFKLANELLAYARQVSESSTKNGYIYTSQIPVNDPSSMTSQVTFIVRKGS